MENLNIDINSGEAFAAKVKPYVTALEELERAVAKLSNAPIDKLKQQMSEITSSISQATKSLQGLAQGLDREIKKVFTESARKAEAEGRQVSQAFAKGLASGGDFGKGQVAALVKGTQAELQKGYAELAASRSKFTADALKVLQSQGVELLPKHQAELNKVLAAEQAHADAVVKIRKETAARIAAVDVQSAASRPRTVAPTPVSSGVGPPAVGSYSGQAAANVLALLAGTEKEIENSDKRIRSLVRKQVDDLNKAYNEALEAGQRFEVTELRRKRTSGVTLSPDDRSRVADHLAAIRQERQEYALLGRAVDEQKGKYAALTASQKALADERSRSLKEYESRGMAELKAAADAQNASYRKEAEGAKALAKLRADEDAKANAQILAARKALTAALVKEAEYQAARAGLTGLPAQASVIRSAVRQGVKPEELPSKFSAGQIAESLAGQTAAEKQRESLASLAAEKKRNSLAAGELTAQHKRMTAGMNEAHSAARGLASGFGAMWLTYGQLAPLLAGAAFSTAAVSAVKMGVAVGKELGTISALGGASTEEIESLNKKLLEMARTGPFGPLQVAEAMKTLSLAGQSAKEQLESIGPVLRFALAGEVDPNKAAETLVAVATAYGYTAREFDLVGDIIAKTAASSMASVADMSEAFKVSSVVAQQYGVSLQEMSLNLALLSQVGVKGTAGGTAAKNMIADLTGITAKAAKAMKDLGITAFDELKKSMNPEALVQLYQALSDRTVKQQNAFINSIFNDRASKAYGAFASAVRKQFGEGVDGLKKFETAYDQMKQKLLDAPGFTFIASINFEQTTDTQIKGVAASFQAAMVEAFQGVEPAVQNFAMQMRTIINSKEFAAGMKDLLAIVANAGTFLIEYRETIWSVVKALAAWKLAMMGMNIGSALAGSLVGIGTMFDGLINKAKALTAATAAVSAAPAVSAIYRQAPVAAAVVPMGGAFATAGAAGTAASIAATGTAAAAATGATTGFAKALGFVGAALGPIGLLLSSGAMLYMLFKDKAIDASVGVSEAVRLKAISIEESLDAEITKLDKEIELLKKGKTEAQVAAEMQQGLAEASIQAFNAQGIAALKAAADVTIFNQAKTEGLLNTEIATISGSRYGQTTQGQKDIKTLENNITELGAQTDIALAKVRAAESVGEARLEKLQARFVQAREKAAQREAYVRDRIEKEAKGRPSGLNDTPPSSGRSGGGAGSKPKFEAEMADLERLKKAQEVIDTELKKSLAELTWLKENATRVEKLAIADIKNLHQEASYERIAQIHAQNVALAEANNPTAKAAALLAIRDLERSSFNMALEEINQLAAARDIELSGRVAREAAALEAEKNAIAEKIKLAKEAVASAEGLAGKKGLAAGDNTKFREMEGNLKKLQIEEDLLLYKDKALEDARAAHAENERNRGIERKALIQAAIQGYDKEILSAKQAESASNEALRNHGKTAEAIAFEKLAVDRLALARAEAALANSQQTGEALQLQEKQVEMMRAMVQSASTVAINNVLDESKIISYADTFKSSFGSVGDTIGQLVDKIKEFGKVQTDMGSASKEAWEKYQTAKKEAQDANDFEKEGKVEKDYLVQVGKMKEKSFQNDMKMYGAVAKTAQGFFKEGSKGYKAMEIASNVFTLVATVNAFLVGLAEAKAATAAQGKGDPYSAWARIAAMAAAMAALGFNVASFGGGKGRSSDQDRIDRQAANGTGIDPRFSGDTRISAEVRAQAQGAVLGDNTAKSESISKSLELLENSARMELTYHSQMLTALKSIDSGIESMAAVIYRTTGLTTGKGLDIKTGTIAKLNMPGPMTIGEMLGLTGLWGSIKRDITDIGLRIQGTVGSLSTLSGARAGIQQYADVSTTTSSWFGLVKKTETSQQLSAINEDLGREFSLVFANIGTVLMKAGVRLGKDAQWLEEYIRTAIVNIPELSLKGLKGQELKDALSAAMSAMSDSLASYLFPELREFQKVGEGVFQTLIRVSSGIESGGAALDRFGLTMGRWQDVVNKTGDIGAELFRDAVLKAETRFTYKPGDTTFGTGLSNIGTIMKDVQGTAEDLAATYRQLIDVQVRLTSIGRDNALTTTTLRGAGGLDKFQTGVLDFITNFTTEAERMRIGTVAISAEFRRFGQNLPTDAESFRKLVDGIDLTTESGQLLYGQLIGLSGPFAQWLKDNEKYEASLKKLQDTVLGTSFEALTDAAKPANAALITLAGGLDALVSKISAYQQAFYSGTELAALSVRQINSMFTSFGRKTPESMADYRRLVDDTTAASERDPDNKQLRNFLLRLIETGPAFAAAIKGAEALKKAIAGLPFAAIRNLSVEARDALIDLAGGLESFTSSINAFTNNFYTEAERQVFALDLVTQGFAEMGVAAPQSRQAFREMVEQAMRDFAHYTNIGDRLMADATGKWLTFLLGISNSVNTAMPAATAAPDQRQDTNQQPVATAGDLAEARALWKKEQLEAIKGFAEALRGLPFANLTTLSDGLRDALVAQAGGMEAFTKSMSNYWEKFHKGQAITLNTLSDLTDKFRELGQTMPATREEFARLMDDTISAIGASDTRTGFMSPFGVNDAPTGSPYETEFNYQDASRGKKAQDLFVALSKLVDPLDAYLTELEKFDKIIAELPLGQIANLAPAARDGLIKLMGGIDAFSEKTSSYYANFYTEEEKKARVMAALTSEFAAFNIKVPESREAFRALTDGVLESLASGKPGMDTLAVALLGMQQRFFDVVPATEAAAAGATDFAKKLREVIVALGSSSLTNLAQPALDALIKLAGGIEAFTNKLESFYTNFFTAEENTARRTREMTESLAALGLQMPTTREGFRALVTGAAQTLETEAGQRVYNALLDLQQSFANLVPAAEAASKAINDIGGPGPMAFYGAGAGIWDPNAAKAEEAAAAEEAKKAREAAVDAAMASLQKSIEKEKKIYDAQAKVAQETVTNLTSIFDVLKSGVAGLASTNQEAKQELAKQGLMFLDNALATAQVSGYLPEKDALAQAIEQAKGGLDESNFASSVDMERMRGVLAGKLEALKDIAGAQLTPAQAQLKAAQDQIAALDAVLKQAQDAVDVFKNIDAGILSVAAALDNVYKAIAAGNASLNPVPTGYDFKALGESFTATFGSALTNGFTALYSQVSGLFESNGTGQTAAITPVANSQSVYFDGSGIDYSRFDSAGPKADLTVTNAQTAANVEMVAQLEAIKIQLADLTVVSLDSSRSSAQTADLLDRATLGGGPMQTLVVVS